MHCFALHVVPTGADVKGRVKKPKLDKDLAKLKVLCCAFCGKRRGLASYRLFFSFPWQDLFAFCEDANFREVPELPEEIVASVFGLYEFRVQALWSKELQIKKGQTREADNGCGPLHPILLALLARCSAGLGTSCRHMVSGPTK